MLSSLAWFLGQTTALFFFVSRFAEFHFTSCSFPFLSHFWSAAFLFPFLFDMFDYLLFFFLSSFVIIPFLLASIRRTPGLLFSQPALKKKRTTSLSTPRPYTDLKNPGCRMVDAYHAPAACHQSSSLISVFYTLQMFVLFSSLMSLFL